MEDLSWISLNPSRIARLLHGAVALLAIGALSCSALPGWLIGIFTLILITAARWRWQQDKRLVVLGLSCREGHWVLQTVSGEIRAELVGEQVILPWLVVMQWRVANDSKKISLALWPDSADADALRRLRVFLRYG